MKHAVRKIIVNIEGVPTAALVAADEDAKALIDKLKEGVSALIDIRRPRNIRHHRKMFALLAKVAHNLPEGLEMDTDTLLEVIKIRVGHVTIIPSSEGEVILPKSINFGAMDQTAFEAFYEKAIKYVCEKILPGMDREDLEREIAGEY